jgi:hypothetical protein
MRDFTHKTYLNIFRSGTNRTMPALARKYKSITSEIVAIYLNLCTSHQQKVSAPKKGGGSDINTLCRDESVGAVRLT